MTEVKTKLIIDTNIWVSMAMGSRLVSEQMVALLHSSTVDIVASVELVDELTETLRKPKLQRFLNHERTKNLFDIILAKTRLISVVSQLNHCRDPKDDFIINLAIDAKADFILTGDLDSLVLHPLNTCQIVTLNHFLEQLQKT